MAGVLKRVGEDVRCLRSSKEEMVSDRSQLSRWVLRYAKKEEEMVW